MQENTTFAKLRSAFFTGLMLLSPLAVTLFVFVWMVRQVGGSFRAFFFFWVPLSWLGDTRLGLLWDMLSTCIVVAGITLLGLVSRWVLTRYFGGYAERLILGIPGIGALYQAVKQIVNTFGSENRAAFSKVVLIRFPHADSRSVGFLTCNNTGEPAARTGLDLVAVFVPTTPNPTSGFLMLVPRSDVIELEMNVKDAMKYLISGGAVQPGHHSAAADRASLAASK
jgi:uncharacterized membrane protein